MDNSEVGRVIIACSTILIFWSLRKPLYAVYLEYGARGFYGFLFTPFIVYSKVSRLIRYERNKWADETIKKHHNNK
jgi:hypothetical protein